MEQVYKTDNKSSADNGSVTISVPSSSSNSGNTTIAIPSPTSNTAIKDDNNVTPSTPFSPFTPGRLNDLRVERVNTENAISSLDPNTSDDRKKSLQLWLNFLLKQESLHLNAETNRCKNIPNNEVDIKELEKDWAELGAKIQNLRNENGVDNGTFNNSDVINKNL